MSTKLGCICKFQSGGTPSKSNQDYYNGGIPWVTTTSLNGKQIDARDAVDWITEKAIDETAAKIVPANSIMVGTRVGVGKVAVNLVDMSTSQDIISLLDIDDSAWDKDFLCKYIQGKNRFLKSQARGATIKGIKIDVLANLDLPEISIDKQRYISTNLDKVNHVIELRKKELEEFDELIRARFVELFGDLNTNPLGWELKKFEDLTDLITDGEHATPRKTDKGIYLLSARNVLNHRLQLDDVDYIDEEEYERISKRVIPQAGDVLLSCSGTIGRCCCVPEGLKFQMVRSTAILRFKDFINPVFAEYMITSDYVQQQIDKVKTASSQANLFQGKIAKLKGFVPPIALQNEFAIFIKQVDKSKVVALKAA